MCTTDDNKSNTTETTRRGALDFMIPALVFLALGSMLVGCNKQELTAGEQPTSATDVAYPSGYRDWVRVKSMAILEGHEHFNAFGGLHHVYGNEKALAALKQGKPFPSGAVLVFDLLEARTEGHTVTEGARKVIGVMEKDPRRYTETEGWGFEDFKFVNGRPQRAVTDARKQCLSCHQTQEATDYVYSTYAR